MAGLQASAVFTYGRGVANTDGTVTLRLTCAQPGEGSGLSGEFFINLSVAQVTAINGAGNNAQKKAALDAIVQAFMVANYRPATVIQAALDLLVGQTVTVS